MDPRFHSSSLSDEDNASESNDGDDTKRVSRKFVLKEENMGSEELKIELPKKKRNLLWLWILIAVIVVGGGASAYAFRESIKDYFSDDKKVADEKPEAEETAPAVAEPASIKIVDEGITWLNPRVKLEDLGLFKAGSNADFPDSYQGTTYYKVATTSDGGEIILALVKMEGLGFWYDLHHFLKKGGIYYWLSENSDSVGGEDNYYARTSSDTNSTMIILSLRLDDEIINGATKLAAQASASRSESVISSENVGTVIDETKWGDLYLLKGDDIDGSDGVAKVTQYYVLRNDGVRIIYWPTPGFRLDDGTLNVTWSDPAGSGAKFSQIKTSGCGGGGGSFPLVISTDSMGAKKEVGVSSTGEKIYAPAADSVLTEFAYQVYLMDEMPGKVGKPEFSGDLGALVWQDGYDNWIVFMNDKYAPAVECGKPVVYLYPEKTTEVVVKVGANIRVSDPDYEMGWRVVASPDGKLETSGKIYDSLFWEGIGWGEYPAISSGTVVGSLKVAGMITAQMKEMGLNTKEIADFNQFWLPKMPKTSFVRLTWLTTEEMNTLAPLSVSPKPDTMIRVFLDFEGLDSKVSIAPQVLPHYERMGFTLVEWGGLLKGGK